MFRIAICFIVIPSLLLVTTSIQTWVPHDEVAKPGEAELQPLDTERPVKVGRPRPTPPKKTGNAGPNPPPLRPPAKKASKSQTEKKSMPVGNARQLPASAHPVKVGKPSNNPSPTQNSLGTNIAAPAPANPQTVIEPKTRPAGVSTAATGENDALCMDSNRLHCVTVVSLCNRSGYEHVKQFCRKTCGLCSTHMPAETSTLPRPSAPETAQFGDITEHSGKGPGSVGIGPAMPNDMAANATGSNNSPFAVPFATPYVGEPFNKTGPATMTNISGPPATATTNNNAEELDMPCADNLMLPCSHLVSKCNSTAEGERVRSFCPMSCGICSSTPTMPMKADDPAKTANVSTAAMAPTVGFQEGSTAASASTVDSQDANTAATTSTMDSQGKSTAATANSEICMDTEGGINMKGVKVQCADMLHYCHTDSAFSPYVKKNCQKSCGDCFVTPRKSVAVAVPAATDASPPSEAEARPFKVGEATDNEGKANHWAKEFGTPPPPTTAPKNEVEAPRNTTKEMPATEEMPTPGPDDVPLKVGAATDSEKQAKQWSKDFTTVVEKNEASNSVPKTIRTRHSAPRTIKASSSAIAQHCMDAVDGIKLNDVPVPCDKMVQYCNDNSMLTSVTKQTCPKSCGLCPEDAAVTPNPPGVNATASGTTSSLKKFDVDNNGVFTRDEIGIILSKGRTGESWAEDDIAGIVKGGDVNMDGQLTVGELEKWMNAK